MKVKDLTFGDTLPSEKQLPNYERQKFLEQKQKALEEEIRAVRYKRAKTLVGMLKAKTAFRSRDPGYPESGKVQKLGWFGLEDSSLFPGLLMYDFYYIEDIPSNDKISKWFHQMDITIDALNEEDAKLTRRIRALRRARGRTPRTR